MARYTRVDLRDFEGGLNRSDSAELLDPTETPDSMNMTLTTRGAFAVRKGCENMVTLPGNPVGLYYSHSIDKWYVQVGATIYQRPGDLSGSWTAHWVTGSSAIADFCDFSTEVVIAHPVSGVSYTDGISLASGSATAKGNCIAVFKNRIWVGGDPGNKSRVWFSNTGTSHTWTTATDFVDIRERDSDIITAIGSGQGMDVQGRPGLQVFKKNSAYRIYDSATGAYTTVDWTNGAVSAHALQSLHGVTYAWGPHGIYTFDGLSPAVQVAPRALAESDIEGYDVVTIGHVEDRIIVARTTTPGEFEIGKEGWLMPHTLANNAQVKAFAIKNSDLYAAVADGSNYYLYKMYSTTPGSDNSVGYDSYYKSKIINLEDSHQIHKVKLFGKADSGATNTKQFKTYLDWESTPRDTFDVSSSLETSDGLEAVVLQAIGHGESFQFGVNVSGGTGAIEIDRVTIDLTKLAP